MATALATSWAANSGAPDCAPTAIVSASPNTGLARAERFFQRWVPAAVFLGRFVGFARALVPLVADITRMPYRRFLLYNIAGAAAWATGFGLLGYFLGRGWHQIESWVGGRAP